MFLVSLVNLVMCTYLKSAALVLKHGFSSVKSAFLICNNIYLQASSIELTKQRVVGTKRAKQKSNRLHGTLMDTSRTYAAAFYRMCMKTSPLRAIYCSKTQLIPRLGLHNLLMYRFGTPLLCSFRRAKAITRKAWRSNSGNEE